MDSSAANHNHNSVAPLNNPLSDTLTASELSFLLDFITVPQTSRQEPPLTTTQESSTDDGAIHQQSDSGLAESSSKSHLKAQFKKQNHQLNSSRQHSIHHPSQSIQAQTIDIVSEPITNDAESTRFEMESSPEELSSHISSSYAYPTTSLLEELGLVAAPVTEIAPDNDTPKPKDHQTKAIDSQATHSKEHKSSQVAKATTNDSNDSNDSAVTSSLFENISNLALETSRNPVTNSLPIDNSVNTEIATTENLIQSPDISVLQTILTPPEMDRVSANLEELYERLKQLENQVYSPELQTKLDSFQAQLDEQLNDQTQQEALSKLTNNLAALSQGYQNIPLTLQKLDQRLANLEENIFDDDRLLNLIQAIWLKLNDQVMQQHTAEITASFVAIIDEVIKQRIKENHLPLSQAFAEIISQVIEIHVNSYPDQIAIAIAPEIATAVKEQSRIDQRAIIEALGPQMGAAIKQQILLERDAMVDALYPVIGNTISKYFAEAIREINQRIERTFSPDGFGRNIRAKLQGVSEAELILRESFPVEIRAIFLIEKYSGLVMVDLQASEYKSNSTPLEAEMIAGMLTAIRSFVSDCLSRDAKVTEVDTIKYGQAKILLEVTGYSYLAVIIEGEPPKHFIQKMRDILAKIAQKYEKELKSYSGDPSQIPSEIKTSLATLMSYDSTYQKHGRGFNLIYVIGMILLGACGWLGWQFYQQFQWHQLEQKSTGEWQNDPVMALYRLSPKVTAEKVILSGYVPNAMLKHQAVSLAGKVVRQEQASLTIDNQVVAMEAPRNPQDTALEVQRLTQSFNQTLANTPNFGLKAQFTDGQVILSGTVTDLVTAQKISQSFSQVPGVRSVTNTLVMRPLAISTQIYFVEGESDLKLSDLPKLVTVTNFLERYPDYHVKILGTSDPRGAVEANYRLALRRAQSVERELIKRGIAKQRIILVPMVLNLASSHSTEYNVAAYKADTVPEWKLRRVEFLVVPP